MKDAVRAVGTNLLQDIVNDNRPAPTKAPSANVTVVGSGRVQEPELGPAYRPYKPPEEDTPTDRSGWRGSTPLKPPEGIDLIDEMVAAQDQKDLAERVKQAAAQAQFRRLAEKDNFK
jgi:hypothetical protein